MTDPGPLEIVSAYKIGEQNGIAVYNEVRTVRDAPTETIMHWERRHIADLTQAFIDYPPYNP